MKKKILLTLSLWNCLFIFGQQEAQTSMYFHNPLQFNSAYAGTRNSLNITGVTRAQWIGWAGAPTTQFFSIHAPIARRKIAIGGTIVQDRIGARSNFNATAHFAYHMRLNSDDLKLSFGASAGIYQSSFNFSGLIATDYTDNNYLQSYSALHSNFGAGLYLHNEKFYVGMSIPKLIHRPLQDLAGNSFTQRHGYLMVGYVHHYNSVVAFKPSVLVKYTSNSSLVADFNFSTHFYKKFWVGVLYRANDALGFNASYQIKDICSIGYAYDFPINGKLVNQWGSHEFVLAFDLRTKNHSFLSPRYF
jgi:type IX secretion system PorP/SprF family membrane protein